jgi:hypothetical protein
MNAHGEFLVSRRDSGRVIPEAVANALFDASGVRVRRAPLSPERVKAALART